ncbi:MAG TPA: histidine phosphatase family protein [Vicinamibacterales bacterium]|nr:histidine phosphatase family protein [Vicinamibacterales bacterium]
MRIYLLHHADAVGPSVDPQRPLSAEGRAHAEQLAGRARERRCAPAAIWHSGKLRARQTAEPFWRICAPFAEFKMVRGLGPDDPPDVIQIAILKETRDLLLVGHIPNLTALLQRFVGDSAQFPMHGIVALETTDGGATWRESWRE